MKNTQGITVGIIIVMMVSACQRSKAFSAPTETTSHTNTHSPTSTILPATSPPPTPVKLITPKITATPINAIISSEDDMEGIIRQIYSRFPCIGYNYAKKSSESPLPTIEFLEVVIQPDSQLHWISEIANNTADSRQAFVACEPELCQDKIYVKEFETDKIFEINYEWRMPWRPIQWITWVNDDILVYFQSSNPWYGQINAVDVIERKSLFAAAVYPDYFCSTPTPTPQD